MVLLISLTRDHTTNLFLNVYSCVVESIDFEQIPPEDFESTAPIVKFAVGQAGSVVVCQHHDGAETWLPIDMWVSGGFTPPSRAMGTMVS